MKLNGLRLDSKFADSPMHTWIFAKNILLSRGFDEIENEPGDTLLGTSTYPIIGKIQTPNEIIIFEGDSTHSIISRINNNTITNILTNSYLTFDSNRAGFRFEGVHQYNNKGELIVVWTTGLDKPMILNCDVVPSITSATDLSKLYLFPQFDHNNFAITAGNIISGGNLNSAAYFISLAYEIDENLIGNFGVISNPIFIMKDDLNTPYTQFQGNESNAATTKAILASISDIDTSKTYFKLAIIKQTATSIDCYITNRILITGSTQTYLINDLSTLSLFDINTVIVSNPAFDKVKTLAQANQRLRIGNLTKTAKASITDIYDKILTARTIAVTSVNRTSSTVTVVTTGNHLLQTGSVITMNGWSGSGFNGFFEITYVNATQFTYTSTVSGVASSTGGTLKTDRLTINWIADSAVNLSSTDSSYKDTKFIFDKRGFRSDEVYALYLGLRLKTGGYYGIYHIPGREAYGTETSATTVVDGETLKNFRIASTATRLGSNYYGKMGYWENENETYNNLYGTTLGTSKVRHHRFPSAGQISSWKSGILHTIRKGTTVDIGTFVNTWNLNTLESYTTWNVFLTSTIVFGLGTFTVPDSYNLYVANNNQTVTLNIVVRALVASYFGGGDDQPGELRITINKLVNTPSGYTSVYTKVSSTACSGLTPEILTVTIAEDVNLNTGDQLTIEIAAVSDDLPVFQSGCSWVFNTYRPIITNDILGLQVSLDWTNIDPTLKASLEDSVDGWEILYAKRTLNNQLMLDQSIAMEYSGGYRWHGFDSMVNLLNIQPTHAKSELKCSSSTIAVSTVVRVATTVTVNTSGAHGLADGVFVVMKNWTGTGINGRYLIHVTSTTRFTYTSATSGAFTATGGTIEYEGTDLFEGAFVKDIINYTADTTRIRKVTEIKYLPAYNTATIPNNADKENCYFFKTATESFNNRLVSLMSIKNDLYLDFSSHKLISTGVVKQLTSYSNLSFYGGDCFIGHHAIVTFPYGVHLIWNVPVQSSLNTEMRYEGINDYEKVFPYTDITVGTGSPIVYTYIAAMKTAGVANLYFYNNDFHLTNSIRQDSIDNNLTSTITTFPNRIYSSQSQPLSVSASYWRKFAILDYFDMQNNKGAIYKMLGNEYVMYIQTDYSIFRGVVIDQLNTNSATVGLQTTQIFDRPLQELHDADGNYIRPYNAMGTILTPYGLVVVDSYRGSVYVISDKVEEISKLGIEDWFRNLTTNLLRYGSSDTIASSNNLFQSGLHLAYDDLYKRLLITIKNYPIPVSNVVGVVLTKIATVTTLIPHNLKTGMTITMSGWINGYDATAIVTVSDAYNFTYYAPNLSSAASSGGYLKTITDTTISFQFELSKWVALHDYSHNSYAWNSNGLYGFSKLSLLSNVYSIYKKFSGNVGYYEGSYYSSFIDFVFNSNTSERFLLKFIKWVSNVEYDGISHWDETISNLMVYSKNLCTNSITISKKSYGYNSGTYALEETGNAIYKDGEWTFTDLKDYLTTPNSVFIDANGNLVSTALNLSKNWFEMSKIISKFVIVRLGIINSASNKKVRISNVIINAKNIL